jgi:hypothetical protein
MFICPKCLRISDVVLHFPALGKGLDSYFPECHSLTKEVFVGGSGEM